MTITNLQILGQKSKMQRVGQGNINMSNFKGRSGFRQFYQIIYRR